MDEEEFMFDDPSAGADPAAGWDNTGVVTTYDDLTPDLYHKDPAYVAPSEVDYLGQASNLLKSGTPLALGVLPKPPASVTPLIQKLWPGYSQGASVPPPNKRMSTVVTAGLIVGGIIVGIIVIGLGLKLVKG